MPAPNTFSGRFDSDTARRLLNMLRVWEREPRFKPSQASGPRRRGDGGGGSTQVAKLTSSVGAGSSTTPGLGTAIPQKLSTGTYAANGPSISVNNINDKTFASGSIVVVSKDPAGLWWIVNLDSCTHSS